MTYKCYAICSTGNVRTDNQDNLYINGVYRQDISNNSVFRHRAFSEDNALVAVADGMGGGKYGERASLEAVKALDNVEKSTEGILRYLNKRNDVICALMDGNGRIGTTFAGLYINEKNVEIINIGDSRIYRFADGELSQLSRDHTVAQQMVDFGVMDKAEVADHPEKHKLTQHLGIFPSEFIIEPFTTQIDAYINDVFLLCSDGLTDMLDDTEIESVLNQPGDVEKWAELLYEEATQNGGKDNITILLLQVIY